VQAGDVLSNVDVGLACGAPSCVGPGHGGRRTERRSRRGGQSCWSGWPPVPCARPR